MWAQVRKLLSPLSSSSANSSDTQANLAGQELIHLLQCSTTPNSFGHLLSNPQQALAPWVVPNPQTQQRLHQTPVVLLTLTNNGTSTSTSTTQEAPLTPAMLQDICSVAADLRISEQDALLLYVQVATDPATRALFNDKEGESFVDQALGTTNNSNNKSLAHMARELYFCERHALYQTLLLLVQSRLQGEERVLEATDALLVEPPPQPTGSSGNLVVHLVQAVHDWTHRMQQLAHELAVAALSQPPTNHASIPPQQPQQQQQSKPPPNFAKVHLAFAQQERQAAVDCLFYLAYHTQLTGSEVVAILDLIQHLTNGSNSGGSGHTDPNNNGLLPLDPSANVPSPYETTTGTATAQQQPPPPWAVPQVAFFSQQQQLSQVEKNRLAWQQELIEQVWSSGKPQLLTCVAPLVLAGMCAMDAQHVLMDRYIHGPNATFGVVRARDG
jgi:hypothetical protein